MNRKTYTVAEENLDEDLKRNGQIREGFQGEQALLKRSETMKPLRKNIVGAFGSKW